MLNPSWWYGMIQTKPVKSFRKAIRLGSCVDVVGKVVVAKFIVDSTRYTVLVHLSPWPNLCNISCHHSLWSTCPVLSCWNRLFMIRSWYFWLISLFIWTNQYWPGDQIIDRSSFFLSFFLCWIWSIRQCNATNTFSCKANQFLAKYDLISVSLWPGLGS